MQWKMCWNICIPSNVVANSTENLNLILLWVGATKSFALNSRCLSYTTDAHPVKITENIGACYASLTASTTCNDNCMLSID